MIPLPPSQQAATPADDGLEVIDLRENEAFAARRLHTRDAAVQFSAMERLAHAFVEHPETLLKELVQVAVDLCGADSAGISVERDGRTDANFYHWVATAGTYSGFLNATLPRYPSACGICLERGGPQLFRVSQRFFDILGVEAPLVTDGLLLPWQADDTRGTIFVMAHGRTEAFDLDDCRMMQTLANFAATAVRQIRQREQLLAHERTAAAASMANHLAHEINNPLQSLVNVLYLAGQEAAPGSGRELAHALSPELQRLSELVAGLLALPIGNSGPEKRSTPE